MYVDSQVGRELVALAIRVHAIRRRLEGVSERAGGCLRPCRVEGCQMCSTIRGEVG